MYAVTLDSSSSASFTARLGALYTRRSGALRELARRAVPTRADAWDVVHDAFLSVLESPPEDTSDAALGAALERAVRAASGRHAGRRADDAALRVALRKRSV
jgi:DNA-directed RNA polymerase specialized sigma24 family protein